LLGNEGCCVKGCISKKLQEHRVHEVYFINVGTLELLFCDRHWKRWRLRNYVGDRDL
jgi:hypothetical protein